MGQAISAAVDSVNRAEAEASMSMSRAAGAEARETLHTTDPEESRKKEQLVIMMKLANARLDTFEDELKSMFLDPDSAMKTSVPGKRALRFERHCLVDVEHEDGKGVEDAVDDFFGTYDGSKAVLAGLKGVVKGGLATFLEDKSPGESTDARFFVGVQQNAIIRVDMYSWKYNFVNTGTVGGAYKNIMAYVLCVSEVDHRAVTLDELIYLASEHAGNGATGPDAGFEAYLNMLMRTWNQLRAVDVQPGNGTSRPNLEYPIMRVASSLDAD